MKRLTQITVYLILGSMLSAQWVQQNPNYPDTNALNSIFFIDENNGWTSGSYDDEWGGPSFYSYDAGNTWDWMFTFQSINGIYLYPLYQPRLVS
jgi:hypothetical protein